MESENKCTCKLLCECMQEFCVFITFEDSKKQILQKDK